MWIASGGRKVLRVPTALKVWTVASLAGIWFFSAFSLLPRGCPNSAVPETHSSLLHLEPWFFLRFGNPGSGILCHFSLCLERQREKRAICSFPIERIQFLLTSARPNGILATISDLWRRRFSDGVFFGAQTGDKERDALCLFRNLHLPEDSTLMFFTGSGRGLLRLTMPSRGFSPEQARRLGMAKNFSLLQGLISQRCYPIPRFRGPVRDQIILLARAIPIPPPRTPLILAQSRSG